MKSTSNLSAVWSSPACSNPVTNDFWKQPSSTRSAAPHGNSLATMSHQFWLSKMHYQTIRKKSTARHTLTQDQNIRIGSTYTIIKSSFWTCSSARHTLVRYDKLQCYDFTPGPSRLTMQQIHPILLEALRAKIYGFLARKSPQGHQNRAHELVPK